VEVVFSILSNQLSVHGFRGTKESHAFEFFYYKTASIFSGYFYGKLWRQSLFQISLQDEAVWSATVALSSFFENECIIAKLDKSNHAVDHNFALQSYNLAIRHLLKYLDDPGSNLPVVLLICIIFVCVDFVRHDIEAARSHITGGLKILEPLCLNPSLLPTSQRKFFEDILAPTLSWLNMSFCIFGGEAISVKYLCGSTEQPPLSKHESVEQTIAQFVDIASAMITFNQRHGHLRFTPIKPPAISIEQLHLLSSLEEWRENYEASLNNTISLNCNTTTANVEISAGLIKAGYISLKLWFETMLVPGEAIWDLYKTEFEQVILLSSKALDDPTRFPDTFSKSFAFEMPFIPILQLVAIKCRYPSIRRQALNLLCHCPEQESMFQARYSYNLCKRMIEIEQGVASHDQSPMVGDHDLPPESKRIWMVDIPPIAATKHGRAVNFLIKPWGQHGKWKVITEYLHIKNLQLLRWGWDQQSSLEAQMMAEVRA
jgi:hypothetical protein